MQLGCNINNSFFISKRSTKLEYLYEYNKNENNTLNSVFRLVMNVEVQVRYSASKLDWLFKRVFFVILLLLNSSQLNINLKKSK